MAIRSYNEVYLNEAKRHLGVATDYLANICRFPVDRIGDIYSYSPTMVLFGRGASSSGTVSSACSSTCRESYPPFGI